MKYDEPLYVEDILDASPERHNALHGAVRGIAVSLVIYGVFGLGLYLIMTHN